MAYGGGVRPLASLLLTALFLLAGCADDAEPADASFDDRGQDAGTPPDAERPPVDAEAADADPPETSPLDAETLDAEPADAGPEPCEPGSLRPLPAAPEHAGPWPVGARTASVGGLTVEVYYPAVPGSETSTTPVRYDLRQALPLSERAKVSDADNPWQSCDCYRDLPLDEGFGPYPVVLFAHGTAGFRTQSLEQLVHWASRGFVVLSADHPGLWLQDLLALACGQPLVSSDVPGDLRRVLAALAAPSDDLSFLAGHIDLRQLGMAGHSAGGGHVRGFSDEAKVIIPLASGGTLPGSRLSSSLIMAGTADRVVSYAQTRSAYDASPRPRRFVGLDDAGHLAFSSLCSIRNSESENIVEVGLRSGVCGLGLAGALFDCASSYLPDPIGWRAINAATAWVLERELHCSSSTVTFSDLGARHPSIVDLDESL